MVNNKIIKLKKYLFLISILFLMVSLTHLIYIYLYDDSELVPIKWWTISEWLIWSFPSLNPLKQLNGNNKYIIGLLYRSLLKYDTNDLDVTWEWNKIVWDLANCDISNLLNIECYLNDNIFWSNWDPITATDVVNTYKILQTTWVNKITSSLLEETEIEQKDNTIIFKNKKKDINFLNIFFQPILSDKTINSIWTETIFWDFPTHEQIYSWIFKIGNISSDMTIWITKIFLEKNEFNDNSNISKLILKLFPNTNSLLQNKESINIFNDNNNIIGDSIPRLESHKYTMPQYVSLFINKDNIENLDLRNFILNQINTENLVKILWEDNFNTINNPFLTKTNINKIISDKNFEKIIADLWYIKKSKIIEKYLPSSNKIYSNEAIINNNIDSESSTWKLLTTDENSDKIPENLSIDDFQEESKYIVNPTFVEKYNFITKDDLLLTWNAGKWVEEVYINDYKLWNFKEWNSKFYYRLKESFNSIKQWENNYKIYFVENWKKTLKEEINFLYYKNNTTLHNKTTEFVENLYLSKKKEEEKTPKKVEKIEINKDELAKLSNLDEKYYYNENLDSFSINLYYISSEKELEETAYFIKNSLVEIWINVELFPLTISGLSKILSDKWKYDMLLTWLNLWYFDYNIFPYFHSSQVKNGYNFSNVKKTGLDILLEELKSWIKTPEKITDTREKILEILKNEQVVKTLYTPKINLLIDKNLKNIQVKNKLINKSERKYIFNSIYIKEEKIINFENKWFSSFFRFLFKKFVWVN